MCAPSMSTMLAGMSPSTTAPNDLLTSPRSCCILVMDRQQRRKATKKRAFLPPCHIKRSVSSNAKSFTRMMMMMGFGSWIQSWRSDSSRLKSVARSVRFVLFFAVVGVWDSVFLFVSHCGREASASTKRARAAKGGSRKEQKIGLIQFMSSCGDGLGRRNPWRWKRLYDAIGMCCSGESSCDSPSSIPFLWNRKCCC